MAGGRAAMSYWPWWLGGAALAGVIVGHWLLTRRMMAVSGRVTVLVDRVRFGSEPEEPEMTPEQLVLAMRAATAAEFGASALDGPSERPQAPASDPPPASLRAPGDGAAVPLSGVPLRAHFTLLGGGGAGGARGAALGGGVEPSALLCGEVFSSLFGRTHLGPYALLFGGLFVGFGTRMAGGCTSGHGLCGVSRGQSGSILATVAFLATGVVTSLLLRALS